MKQEYQINNMHVRPIEERDLPTLADIATRAWIEDELFAWLMPKRHEYPASWRRWMTGSLRALLVKRGCWGYVVVPSADPQHHNNILGSVWWERTAGPELAPSLVASKTSIDSLTPEQLASAKREARAHDPWSNNHTSWYATLNRTLLGMEQKFDVLTRRNPVTDYARLATFRNPTEDNADSLAPLEAGITHWHLSVMTVDPAHQRQGVASALVRHGMELVRKESRDMGASVPITLGSSEASAKLYHRLGFRTVKWLELEDGPGAQAMVWDESDTWIENAEEGTLHKGQPVQAVWSQRALDRVKILQQAGV